MARYLQDVHGLIFHHQRFHEADVLAQMLTKEAGFLTVIIHGALKQNSRLAGASVNFSSGTYIIMTSGHGLSTLRNVKSSQQFEYLFSDLTANAYASYLLDLTRHAFVEYEPIGAYYDLIMEVLQRLDQKQDPELLTQLVQLQLLPAYGVGPQFAHCVYGPESRGMPFDYSIQAGGVICQRHFSQAARMHLPAQATALLRTLALVPIKQLGQITIKADTKQATRKAIDQIYGETLDLDLKSKRFLDELRLSEF
ncbi:MAG: DNA repair protein RecO [Lactobacillus sp.]|jgi:DNA repair protein RecO (recombination protein O)|nr:DNA repair protein RecO [Lactobacillus sp.]MCI1481581.1 DNA repair protein RecO [Lactobacillus sp.]